MSKEGLYGQLDDRTFTLSHSPDYVTKYLKNRNRHRFFLVKRFHATSFIVKPSSSGIHISNTVPEIKYLLNFRTIKNNESTKRFKKKLNLYYTTLGLP